MCRVNAFIFLNLGKIKTRRDNTICWRTSPYEQNTDVNTVPFFLCSLSVLVIKIFCETVTKQCYKITQECDYKMMPDTCILIIYTSQEQYNYFFINVTHKAKCEQNGMLVKCLDKKNDDTLWKLFVFVTRKARFWSFVIVISSLPPIFLLYLKRK